MTRSNQDASRDRESWFGQSIQGPGGRIETPECEEDIIDILRDRDGFPSPVRPVGSRHSMTECISAQAANGAGKRWGTLVDMTRFTKFSDGTQLRIDRRSMTATVPAGRTFYKVAHELAAQQLQFRVNTELGTLTMGAAACGATKDSSFPGEYGQVCADVVGIRLVKPDGKLAEYREGDAELDALRCSYGLFGIVTEVTFRVYPLEYISIEHDRLKPAGGSFTAAELKEAFDAWLGEDPRAVFLYLFPFRHRIVAELRRKPALGGAKPKDESLRMKVRNFFWEKGLHHWDNFTEKAQAHLHAQKLAAKLQDGFDSALGEFLDKALRLARINPVSQIVDFDRPGRASRRFTFSMWAFPEDRFCTILPEYLQLRESHEAALRSSLPDVSYHIACDRSSLLSYSYDGPVWTLDPICPVNDAGSEWEHFLAVFNDFCSERGGVPLLNQTPYLKRAHVERAFRSGARDRLAEFESARRRFDPGNRMLNAYFADLLAI